MRNVVYICSVIVLMYLFLVSILSTCTVRGIALIAEPILFRPDYPVVHFMAVFALMGILFWLRKTTVCRDYDKAVWFVVGVWGFAAALWALCCMELPKDDPANVLLAARQMREYNFSSFTGEGYLNIWAGNRGLALFFYLLSFPLGVDNYALLRLLNVAAMMVVFLLLYKIVGELWGKGKRVAFWTVALCACFAPVLLYTTFIYGDIYGLCLAVAAVFAQMKYLRGGYKLKWLMLSAAFISFAALLKMNYLIILIAMAAVAVYDVFRNKNWKGALLYFAAVVVVMGGMKTGCNTCIRNIVKVELSDGVPYEAWAAMGLQEGVRGAGNYNGYNREVYVDNGYDNLQAKKEARESIKESMHTFAADPGYALDFFAHKTASQWNNPNFWAIINGVETERGGAWLVNSIQAGARYAFPYYLLLIPYGGMGLLLLEKTLEKSLGKMRESEPDGVCCRRKYRLWGVGLILFASSVFLPYLNHLGKVVIVYAEEEEREVYDYIADGYYTISAAEDGELYLTEMDGKIILMSEDRIVQEVSMFRMERNYIIRFMPSQNTLELAGGGEVAPGHEEYAGREFEWEIWPAGPEGEYCIRMDDRTALEYSLEDWSVRLGEFEEGNRMQIWVIR